MDKSRSVISRQTFVRLLLDSFIRNRHYAPSGAHRIHSWEELPLAQQAHARQIDGRIWRAWSNGTRVLFVTANPVNRVSCEHSVGLQMMFFDMDGRLVSSGVWIWIKHRGWILYGPTALRKGSGQ
jgi:hypothetical protein